jgi:uncharacterized membrane protein
MAEHVKKDTEFERVLFFSDAVVAIAITLLALDLRLELPEGHHLTFEDLLEPWQRYLAFFLSFVMIADFWRTHHQVHQAIKKFDEKSMGVNTTWLFFIVTLPFTTTLLSTHFGDSAAIFAYSFNIFLISVCQNFIWDYPWKKGYIEAETLGNVKVRDIRTMLNLDMINGLIAVIVSLVMPRLAFFLLFFKLPIIFFSVFFIGAKRRRELIKSKSRHRA